MSSFLQKLRNSFGSNQRSIQGKETFFIFGYKMQSFLNKQRITNPRQIKN